MLSAWMARQRYQPRVQVTVVVVALAVLAFFLAGAYGKARRPGGYDVHCFLAAARAVRAGLDPYLADMPIRYNYPLLPGTAAVPLTFLPEAVVHAGWFLASLAAWLAAAALLVGRWTGDRGPGLLLPLGCAALLLLGPIQNHLLNGQTDAFVLLACVLFWTDWHEGRPRRAAWWLGLGVSLKLVPALFFVPLVLRRSWPVLAAACLWVLVLSVALPALFLGTGVLSAYGHYSRALLLAELTTSAHSLQYPHCYSLYGALTRLAPAWQTSLGARAAAVLVVLLPLCALEWRASPWRRLLHLETYLAAILLLAPVSQPHHLTLLLPCAWLTALRWSAAPARTFRAELLELAPWVLLSLSKGFGTQAEVLAVTWLFAAALGRAAGLGRPLASPVHPLGAAAAVPPEAPAPGAAGRGGRTGKSTRRPVPAGGRARPVCGTS